MIVEYKLVKIEYNCHIYRKRHFHKACFPQTILSISQPSVEISSKFKMYNNPDILEKTWKKHVISLAHYRCVLKTKPLTDS